jgi:hypothetical protein
MRREDANIYAAGEEKFTTTGRARKRTRAKTAPRPILDVFFVARVGNHKRAHGGAPFYGPGGKTYARGVLHNGTAQSTFVKTCSRPGKNCPIMDHWLGSFFPMRVLIAGLPGVGNFIGFFDYKRVVEVGQT